MASDADLVVADLEDAVAPAAKDEARACVARLRPRAVRVNGADTPWFADDIAACVELELDALVLPKATPDGVDAAGATGGPVVALVETAQGLRNAYETAMKPRVAALALGGVDLSTALGLEPLDGGLELLYARSKLVVDSAAAGVRAPIDSPHTVVDDFGSLEAETLRARSLGFGGKICIHPRQVAVVNRCFEPSEEEVRWAERVIERYTLAESEGAGVVALDGAMIDRPVADRARRILLQAGRDDG
jgi:citrate lyase subunit beta/citryl-CoA lyase